MMSEAKFQIGKSGITQGVIDSLNLALKNHKRIRIAVLKSAARDKEKLKLMADDLCSKLVAKCGYRILGFTIILVRLK